MKNALFAISLLAASANAVVIINSTEEIIHVELKEECEQGKQSHEETLNPSQALRIAIAGKLAEIRIDSEYKCGSTCQRSSQGRCQTKDSEGQANGSHDSVKLKNANKDARYKVSRIGCFLNISQNK